VTTKDADWREWVLVPREATAQMVVAMVNAPISGHPETGSPTVIDMWAEAIAAAPQFVPPAVTDEGGREMSYTKGPWRWEFNPKTKTVQLCGGKPEFDLTVMDFVRVGMFGAGPRVIDKTDLGLLAGVVLRHPDLDLIAAAPELAEALRMVVAADTAEDWSRAVDYARKALAKAGVK